MKKEDLFEKLKRNTHVRCDMPDMNMVGIVYDDPLAQFCEMVVAVGGTDVGILRGELGVAENACVWVPQTMKEKAVMFISEELVLLLDRNKLVHNMHEAYTKIAMNDYGYGCFISGPSKTADIEQALVMGAQAARGVTVVLT